MNKVRTKKGDKFEEKNWSSSTSNENGADDEDAGADDDVLGALPGLPSNFQQALTAARLVSDWVLGPVVGKPAGAINSTFVKTVKDL